MRMLQSRHLVVWKYNNLLKELVIRDIKVRYRRSVLGLLWTLLYPLLTMIITSIVFSSLFRTLPNYAVYFLSGSILFTFHTEATISAAMSIVNNAGLLKKIYIPKYLFPLSRVLSSLVNLGFAFVALLLVMLVTGAPFYPALWLSLIPIFYLVIFTTGLSLSLSALTVYFRDVNSLYGVLALLWTYSTPIFYPISIIQDKYSWIYEWNPMYYYIDYLRALILDGTIPGMVPNLICLLCGIVSLSIGWFIFNRTHNRFVLYM